MNNRRISFAVEGMDCATCANKLQSDLASVDGVIAANVNYATQRASLVYNPSQLCASRILAAIRREKLDVPLLQTTIYVSDLAYSSSRHTVEQAVQGDGIVCASANLYEGKVDLLAFPGYENCPQVELALKRLGLHPVQTSRARTDYLYLRLLAATNVALYLIVATAGYLLGSGGTHLFISPVTSALVSGLALAVIGYPFLWRAFLALYRGNLDSGVLVALAAILLFLLGIVLAMSARNQPSTWYTASLVSIAISSILLSGWFLVRTWQLYAASSRPAHA